MDIVVAPWSGLTQTLFVAEFGGRAKVSSATRQAKTQANPACDPRFVRRQPLPE